MTEQKYGTVLIKASKILDCLSDGKTKSVQLLSKKTHITPPTISKILGTLEYLNYVSRSHDTKGFFLGPAFIKYGLVRTDATNIIEISRPFLEKLQVKVDETIHLAVPQGNKVVYVNKLEPQNQGIYMTSKIGMTRELYSSGIGKAVLGTYSERQFKAYLSKIKLKPFTPNTITSKDKLVSEINKVKRFGYATDDEEQELGGCCIAMAIVHDDRAVAAVSASLPKFRLTPSYKVTILRELSKTRDGIEGEL
ncbi:helix-turn-helix domain-containing protein [Oenococcus sp. UCMA 14587]|nr:helix-turn-helix domain-containing protein [Oenococcus sp. UCMA 14587]